MSTQADGPATASPRADTDLDLDAPAPPWSYNPAAWSQRIPICVIAASGS